MNWRGKYKYLDLKPCRACGMDAGARKASETIPEKYYVVCEVCGFKTRPHPTQSAASKEWNR